jgi:hypothetical protein
METKIKELESLKILAAEKAETEKEKAETEKEKAETTNNETIIKQENEKQARQETIIKQEKAETILLQSLRQWYEEQAKVGTTPAMIQKLKELTQNP